MKSSGYYFTRRVFKKTGLINQNATDDELMFYARELNPEYPGIFDLPVRKLGKELCEQQSPKCNECCLGKYCPRIGVL